jgi:hypothetical protein
MGYTRDKDAATRGIGAIASRDHANPRAVAMRRARIAHATTARDRALAHMTYGARGGLSLGAISRASAGMLKDIMAPTIKTGGSIEVPPLKTQGLTSIDVRPPLPPVRPPITQPPLPPFPAPSPIRDRFNNLAIRSKNINAVFTPTVIIDPVRPSSGNTGIVPPKVTTKPPGVVTGGGGGGGGGGYNTGVVGPVDLPPMDPLPDVPEGQDAAAHSSLTSNKNLVIAGGVALAAFLYFKNKRR